ncbi:ribosomal protein L7/L12 [Anatilimnocola floriformis]|uniref:ribosomal protein L7/L12 n=1 Tax=Anatilimnocola floriformis TaxID=2948575 RepID=UPI0020C3CC41|nr:ribosomal protein L7/L12 [Anatilimnocola floriformis]
MPSCIHCLRELPVATPVCAYCGASQPAQVGQPQPVGHNQSRGPLSDALLDEVLVIIGRGHKMEAIKVVKDATGLSLLDAKQIVDRLAVEQLANRQAIEPVQILAQPSPVIDRQQIEQLVRQGQKLEAIKIYRQQAGCSLLEAKQEVEALEAALTQQPAAGGGSGGRGCFGMVILLAVLVGIGAIALIR